MSNDTLPASVEPDHPAVTALCAGLPPGPPLATAAAVLTRLGPLTRRWGAGHRPIADVLADRSTNCLEYTVLLLSALRHLGVPAAGLIGTARGTAPICVHAVALVPEDGRWYVLDVDRPAPVPLADVVAAGELRPLLTWNETTAVVLTADEGSAQRCLSSGMPYPSMTTA